MIKESEVLPIRVPHFAEGSIEPAAYTFVVLAGTIAGKVQDPATWVMLSALCVAGLARWPWWFPLLGAITTIATTAVINWSWWLQIGADVPRLVAFGGAATFTIALAAFWFCRLMRRLFVKQPGAAA